MKLERVTRWFLWTCAATLWLTGLLKLVSVFGHARILDIDDTLLGIQTRFVLLVAGLLEVVIATSLCRLHNLRSALWLASWTGFNFLLYRTFRTLSGDDSPCPCHGTVFGWLKFNTTLLNGSLIALSLFMFLGGGVLLWRIPKQSTPSGAV